jgi:hypothetical protein
MINIRILLLLSWQHKVAFNALSKKILADIVAATKRRAKIYCE